MIDHTDTLRPSKTQTPTYVSPFQNMNISLVRHRQTKRIHIYIYIYSIRTRIQYLHAKRWSAAEVWARRDGNTIVYEELKNWKIRNMKKKNIEQLKNSKGKTKSPKNQREHNKSKTQNIQRIFINHLIHELYMIYTWSNSGVYTRKWRLIVKIIFYRKSIFLHICIHLYIYIYICIQLFV